MEGEVERVAGGGRRRGLSGEEGSVIAEKSDGLSEDGARVEPCLSGSGAREKSTGCHQMFQFPQVFVIGALLGFSTRFHHVATLLQPNLHAATASVAKLADVHVSD